MQESHPTYALPHKVQSLQETDKGPVVFIRRNLVPYVWTPKCPNPKIQVSHRPISLTYSVNEASVVLLLLDALFHDEAHSQFALKHLHFTIAKCNQRLFQDDEPREDFVNVFHFL
jgi:hypothetical protein